MSKFEWKMRYIFGRITGSFNHDPEKERNMCFIRRLLFSIDAF